MYLPKLPTRSLLPEPLECCLWLHEAAAPKTQKDSSRTTGLREEFSHLKIHTSRKLERYGRLERGRILHMTDSPASQSRSHITSFIRRTLDAGVSAEAATLLVSLWFSIGANAAFWRAVGQTDEAHGIPFKISLFIFVTCLINLFLTAVVWRGIGKIALCTLIVVSAAFAYFSSTFGIAVDKVMIRNLVETDRQEAFQLMSANLILFIALRGLLPALLLSRLRVRYRTLPRELVAKLLVLLGTFAVIAMVALPLNRGYASFLRNHRELKHLLTPVNYLAATHSFLKDRRRFQGVPESLGTDARRRDATVPATRKRLLVLVIGETARSANFSLGSYPRTTNPRLGARKDLAYRTIQSCGTSTATSLPCIFSNLGRNEFKVSEALRHENLLDVVKHAGVDVLWRDNNSGCKGSCSRVEFEDLSQNVHPSLCRNGECQDEILLEGLAQRLNRTTNDLLVVLHQKGSHGPAYYRRYPPAFEKFVPACRQDDISRCSIAEITNAYDNSILYTDHFLAETLAVVERSSQRFDSAVIYVSDHGESLGEHGIFLHGMPYAIAPSVQTQVPMIVWISPQLRARANLTTWKFAEGKTPGYSHDNIFHSVLGLLNIQTSVYSPQLDIFAKANAR